MLQVRTAFLVIHVPNEAWIISMIREWRASFKIFQDLILFSLMTIRLRSSIAGVYDSINWYELPKQKNVDKNKTYTSYSNNAKNYFLNHQSILPNKAVQ